MSPPLAVLLVWISAAALGACGDDDEGDPGGRARQGVAVTVDGEDVDLQEVCSGHGGARAVVAVAETGRLIILIQEEDDELLLSTEGDTFAETRDVERTTSDGWTRYAGTVRVQGEPTLVAVAVEDGAEDDLAAC